MFGGIASSGGHGSGMNGLTAGGGGKTPSSVGGGASRLSIHTSIASSVGAGGRRDRDREKDKNKFQHDVMFLYECSRSVSG